MPSYPERNKPYEHPTGTGASSNRSSGSSSRRSGRAQDADSAPSRESAKRSSSTGAAPDNDKGYQISPDVEKALLERNKKRQSVFDGQEGHELTRSLGQGISEYTYQLWLLKKKQGGKLKKGDRERIRDQYMADFDSHYNKVILPNGAAKRGPGGLAARKKRKNGEDQDADVTTSNIEAGSASLVDFNKSSK